MTHLNDIIVLRNINKKKFRYLSASLDLIVYAYVLKGVFPSEGLTIANIIPSALFIYGAFLLLLQILNNSTLTFKFNRTVSFFISLVVAYGLLTFLRGLSFNFSELFTLFGNPYVGGLIWLLPFCVYIGKQPGVIQSLLPSFKKHAIIGLVITGIGVVEVFILRKSYISQNALLTKELAFTGLKLLYGAPIVLLTRLAPSFNSILFYRACLLFTLLGALATEQRFYVALSSFYIVLDLIIGDSSSRKSVINKLTYFFSTVGAVIIYLLIHYFIGSLQGGDTVDTRSFLFAEIILDFELPDFIFGRGALGTYFSQYFEIQQIYGNGGDSPIRKTAEVGYLFILLKSGLIGIMSYITVYLFTIITALRSSKSRFAIGMALLLGLNLVEMSVSGRISIYPGNIVLWIFIGALLSRSQSNEYCNPERYV